MKTSKQGLVKHGWELTTARDIMRTDMVTLDNDVPVAEVLDTLSEFGISGAPVVDGSGRIIGVISMKDVLAHYAEQPETLPGRDEGFFDYGLLEEDADFIDRNRACVAGEAVETAEDLMTAKVFSVRADASLTEIAREMADHRIHRIIVEDEGTYVGLISTMEVLNALGG